MKLSNRYHESIHNKLPIHNTLLFARLFRITYFYQMMVLDQQLRRIFPGCREKNCTKSVQSQIFHQVSLQCTFNVRFIIYIILLTGSRTVKQSLSFASWMVIYFLVNIYMARIAYQFYFTSDYFLRLCGIGFPALTLKLATD